MAQSAQGDTSPVESVDRELLTLQALARAVIGTATIVLVWLWWRRSLDASAAGLWLAYLL